MIKLKYPATFIEKRLKICYFGNGKYAIKVAIKARML